MLVLKVLLVLLEKDLYKEKDKMFFLHLSLGEYLKILNLDLVKLHSLKLEDKQVYF